MELFTGAQLKPGNYYSVDSQNMLIYVIDHKHHIRLKYHRGQTFAISTQRNYDFSNLDSYAMVSKYSFNRVKQLINNTINKALV